MAERYLNDAEVAAVTRSVWYEVAMLRDTYDALIKSRCSYVALRNACLEAFLLHVRQLAQFFKCPRCNPQSTDAYAYDLLSKEDWEELAKLIPEDLANARGTASQIIGGQIMHITFKRDAHEGKREWKIDEIYSPLAEAWRFFHRRGHRDNWAKIWNVYPPSIGSGLSRGYRIEPAVELGVYQTASPSDFSAGTDSSNF